MDTNPSLTPMTTNSNNNSLLISEIIKEAWQDVHGFKGTFWLAMLSIIIISIAFGAIQAILNPDQNTSNVTIHHASLNILFISALISIASNIINVLLSDGLYYVSLRRTANLPILSRMIFTVFQSPLLLKLIAVMFLKFFIVIAYVCFIIICAIAIPKTGHWNVALILSYVVSTVFLIFIFIRLSLSELIILDKKISAWSAITLSFQKTKGLVWQLFGLVILQILIVIISIIPLGIGLIWSMPLVYLVFPVVYKRLIGITMTE